MKHISDILAVRQLSLFAKNEQSKGGREWSAFNSVVGDTVDSFPVRAAYKPEVRYSNVVRIRRVRAPHSLFPKRA
ncbi:MAG TPA: hypothetical protein VHD38_03700 [Candidatus Paceibacterota bacterium]|jgi:hypothetical protein|nr:hypothetical protein [Candidatus Paceibacterota bacterium]